MMVSGEAFKDVYELLRQQAEAPCISLIHPLPHFSQGAVAEHQTLALAVATAKKMMQQKFPAAAKNILPAMDVLTAGASFTDRDQSVGFYVSEKAQFTTTFPFPLPERILVEKGFYLLDLLYLKTFDFPYIVVSLTESKGAVYAGALNRLLLLHEMDVPENIPNKSGNVSTFIGAHDFSRDNEDVFLKGKKNLHAFFHHLDRVIDNNFTGHEPLLLFGTRRLTTKFLNRSSHVSKLLSVVNLHNLPHEKANLSAEIWSVIRSYVLEKMNEELVNLNEKLAEGSAVYGIKAVWQAVNENRGATLLVEREPAFEERLEKPLHPGFSFHLPRRQFLSATRAINDMASLLFDSGGQVCVVEKNMLKPYGHIALLTND